MEGFNVSCALWLRWAATVLDLILFLGGCSSNCKGSDVGWVGFYPLSVLSDVLESDVTSGWVDNVGTTGGDENSHLSSLRNAWGECRGVTGGVFSPSVKGSSDVSSEGSTGRKGSLFLRMFILLISLSSSNKSCEQSILKTYH